MIKADSFGFAKATSPDESGSFKAGFLKVDGFFTTCHPFPFASRRRLILIFTRSHLQSLVKSHLPEIPAHNQHCAPEWSTVFSLTELAKHLLEA